MTTPETHHETLPSLDERRAALAAGRPEWTERTLIQHLGDVASRHGERPLVITDERTLTYAETLTWAEQMADGLAALGIRPGDRVGIVMANHVEFTPIKFAVAAAGAVAIPFNYLYKRDELAYVLRQSQCSALITMTRFQSLDYLAMLDDIAPGWDGSGQTALPDLRVVVQLPTQEHERDGVLTLQELTTLGTDSPGGADPSGVSPQDIADILYTSGTTGSPKGVMVTHDNVLRTAYASALTRAFEDGRRILFSLPCYHMFGYVEGLLAATMAAGAIIPQTAFDPALYFAGIEAHRATEILCVPTMTVALLEHPDRDKHDLSSLVAMLSGAAPAPTWVYERAQQDLGITELTTGYGMTECGGAMTLTLPEDPLELHTTTVGAPKLAGVAGLTDGARRPGDLCVYATVHPETGAALPEGTEGELASRGPTMMSGYWGKPEETAATLVKGWVRSGDLGRVLDNGYIKLTGRSKELYKSGGELVMPKEIEELLTEHPGVSQAFAVGVPDERWGEIGCVYVVPQPGASVDAEELLTLCRSRLARFKVPKHVILVDAEDLPTTPTGKIQKFMLVRRFTETAS